MRAYKDSTVSSRPTADSTRMVGSGPTCHQKVEPVSVRLTPSAHELRARAYMAEARAIRRQARAVRS
jgi:hypothetical protein